VSIETPEQLSSSADAPRFASGVFVDIPRPDWADVVVAPLPLRATRDPEVWAREIFSMRHVPLWAKALFAVRQGIVGLIGVDPAGHDIFAIRSVYGEEALLAADDRHLDFRVGVGVDAGLSLVRVTTAVRLRGWRGRLAFIPVRLVHGPIVRAILVRTARRLGRRRALDRFHLRRPGTLPG
jgi:hypothetical protein